MFDTASSQFTLSEFYFTVLQVLRIASEWIQESMDQLVRLAEDLEEAIINDDEKTLFPSRRYWPPEIKEPARDVFKHNWDCVISYQQRLGKGLLSRIDKKQEEVKSLRDGVSCSLVAVVKMVGMLTDTRSFSMRHRSVKRPSQRNLITTFLSSRL
jgi:hypothetical protein